MKYLLVVAHPDDEVLEPSVIFEAKDGKYGQDGSEALER